jgi:two-component system OmpR family response regulator
MSEMPQLLIVDDDEEILSLLTKFFSQHYHSVTVAVDGAEMFEALENHAFDLIILDIMLKGEDGFSLCRRLRLVSKIPVIILTAMGDPTDRIVGLEIGADDYLTKPFNARELLARVKAVLRRTSEAQADPKPLSTETRPVLSFGKWRLDVAKRELRSATNVLIPLSGGEFDLLLAFVEHPQHVLSREQLLDWTGGINHDAYDRSIDTQVSRLRRKLETDAKTPEIIRTVRNGGYMLTTAVQRG